MLLKKIIYGNVYCAVEHAFINGAESFNVLQLQVKKNTLEIVSSETFSTFEDVFNSISKQKHLFLVINNEQVLTKKIEGEHLFQKSISLAFPNISTSDFFIEVLPQSKNSFVSICRKEYLEYIFKVYKDNNLDILGLSLGNLSLHNLLPFINSNEIKTSTSLIQIENDHIVNVEKNDVNSNITYNVNGVNLKSNNVLGFGGVLIYLTDNNATERNFEEKLSIFKSDFSQKRYFSTGLKVGLGSILLLLVINFLLFSNYREGIVKYSNEIQVQEQSKSKLIALKSEVDKKRALISDMTKSTNSRVSYFINELGNSIPTTIQLDKLIYQPVEKTIKSDKPILVKENEIYLKGFSSQSEKFSEWIATLEKKDWIAKVTVIDYGVNKRNKTIFEINITL